MRGKRRLPHNIIRTISKSGFCSRKQALELVMAGKVKINGRTITDPGYKPRKSDSVLVNEKPLPKEFRKIYILFHKPAGYVTTRKDELNRPTVYEFIKDIGDWVFPVGRLDRDSEGLLIFTNDTKLGNVLTEPRYKIERTYKVLITGHISQEEIANILKGVDIGRNERSQPISLKIAAKNDDSTWVEVSLKEGKNREIRRLFEALNRPVQRLIRTKFGSFNLGPIEPGKWIELNKIPPEISKLIKSK